MAGERQPQEERRGAGRAGPHGERGDEAGDELEDAVTPAPRPHERKPRQVPEQQCRERVGEHGGHDRDGRGAGSHPFEHGACGDRGDERAVHV